MVYRMVLCLLFCFNFLGSVELKKLRCSDDYMEIPLILTDFINKGDITEARNRAFVEIEDFRNIMSYSGYFRVNKNYNSNLFFWYFPSMGNPNTDPVILWLQGGPGEASFMSLFTENGPFKLATKFDIKLRMCTWLRSFSMIYIDNPVGTGFSYTTYEGYAQNLTAITRDLYTALKQFFVVFPSVAYSDFYIMGESYAAKYILSLGELIHQSNPKRKKTKINLKGMAISGGFCDPINQINYGDLLYEIGLIDNGTREEFLFLENCIKTHIKNEQWEQAFETFDHLIFGDLTKRTLFQNLTGLDNYYNYLCSEGAHASSSDISYYVNLDDIRRALHVGITHFDVNAPKVVENLKGDIMKSVADKLPPLLDNYKVMFYNGQLDILSSYGLTENFLYNIQYDHISEFKNTTRCIWHTGDEVAGYVKTWGNLSQALIRNAGHFVGTDQPKWTYNMIKKFINNESFCT